MLNNMKIELADGIELHIRKDRIAELIMQKLGVETTAEPKPKKVTQDKPVKRPVGRPKKVTQDKPKKVKQKRRGRKKKPMKKKDILKAIADLKLATANEIRIKMGLSKLYSPRLSVHISELKTAGVLKAEGRRPLKYSLKEMTQDQFADLKFKAWWERITK